MRLYAPMFLAGLFLVVTSSVLRAQDKEAANERAIAAIKRLGGKVEVDRNRPGLPVVEVDLRHTKVIDASLEHLAGLKTLERVSLKETTVTDSGIVYIKGL